MSISVGGGEFYPGRSFSVSQLLYATKKKLRGTTFAGRIATTMKQVEVDFLEQDALEVLSLVRSAKNTFAPINRIPPDVLSLISEYCDTDEELVALTHVCRGWRELFISHASLWTHLDCTDVDKTRAYVERSKTSPLEISLDEHGSAPFVNDAFLLTVPHLGRLDSLSLSGSSGNLLQLTEYFNSPAPLLKKLKLTSACTPHPVIQDEIFDGDLSSLRELRLSGVITNLAWKNLSNLTTFDFRHVPSNKLSVTQLLNFFERAPLLRKIKLENAFPGSSDAPPGRVISLPHLKFFTIEAQPVHTILLNHLLIPAGASLLQEFKFSDLKSPIPSYLPKTLKNLRNLSHITSINLSFDPGVFLRLDGPKGGLYVLGRWVGEDSSSPIVSRRVLRSLTFFCISTTKRLAIEQYSTLPAKAIEKSPVYLTFLPMINLRTLTLTNCLNLPFILALTPGRNPFRTVVCPQLEELILYVKNKNWFCLNELLEMTKERASEGAKLSAITIVGPQELVPAKEVLRLRTHVLHVEYRLDDVEPQWDILPDDAIDTDCESDW